MHFLFSVAAVTKCNGSSAKWHQTKSKCKYFTASGSTNHQTVSKKGKVECDHFSPLEMHNRPTDPHYICTFDECPKCTLVQTRKIANESQIGKQWALATGQSRWRPFSVCQVSISLRGQVGVGHVCFDEREANMPL